MSNLREWTELVLKVIGGVSALVLFAMKVRTDRAALRSEHAKWVTSLYEKFYENHDLKEVRQSVDCGSAESHQKMVTEESPEFTDFLNFFEYVAYLWRNRQLSDAEVNGLFGYYLDCLARSKGIMGYIENTSTHSYEQLAELLHHRGG